VVTILQQIERGKAVRISRRNGGGGKLKRKVRVLVDVSDLRTSGEPWVLGHLNAGGEESRIIETNSARQ
jgi:hypothetical protein